MPDPAGTAIHEAGHAVLGHLLGLRVKQVVLHPEGGGTCQFTTRPPVRTALVVLAAGEAAEAACPHLVLPESWWALA
jgi:Peptidase M50B-like